MSARSVPANTNRTVSLNWSRLLGFDQVRHRGEGPMTKQALLAKVGFVKVGGKGPR